MISKDMLASCLQLTLLLISLFPKSKPTLIGNSLTLTSYPRKEEIVILIQNTDSVTGIIIVSQLTTSKGVAFILYSGRLVMLLIEFYIKFLDCGTTHQLHCIFYSLSLLSPLCVCMYVYLYVYMCIHNFYIFFLHQVSTVSL